MTTAAPGRRLVVPTPRPRLVVKRAKARLDTRAGGTGEFDLILSAGNRDRDGEVVSSDSWALPLPAHVPINLGHTTDVTRVVGSGRPFIDTKGNLRVRGKFAGTELGQQVRQLVREGHLRGVSVEFLKTKNAHGRPVNELVGGAFVMVPANPACAVLSSKAADDGDDGGGPAGGPNPDPAAMVQAVHNASVHLGAQCLSGATQEQEAMAMARATTQAVQTDDGDDTDAVAELQELVSAIQDADPADVADLASQVVAAGLALGGSMPDDDGQDDELGDDELETRALALSIRAKAL